MANANDTFTAGADQSLVDHTSDSGHTWTKDFGNVLTVNAAGDYISNTAPTNSSRYTLGVTPASAEYDVQADCISTIEWSGGVTGRVVEADSDRYTAVYENSAWKLWKTDAGATSTLATYSGDSPNGVTRTVKLEIRDATKKVYVGGVERISSTDNSLTAAGKPGIYWDGNSTGTQMDNWSSTDVVAGGTVYTRTLSDSAIITDAPIRGVKAFRQMPQDALAIAELIARGQMHGRTTFDSVSVSEDVRRAALLFRKENDSATANDSTLRFVQMFRRLLDDTAVTDSLAVTITLGGTIIVTRILQDGLNVQDTVMRAVRMYRRESQVVDVLDNSWYSASVVRGLIDTLSVAETAARAMMRGRVVSDSVEAVDLAVRYALLYRLLHDDAEASDSMARTITYYQTLIGFVMMSLRNEPVVMAIDEDQPIIMEMRNI